MLYGSVVIVNGGKKRLRVQRIAQRENNIVALMTAGGFLISGELQEKNQNVIINSKPYNKSISKNSIYANIKKKGVHRA